MERYFYMEEDINEYTLISKKTMERILNAELLTIDEQLHDLESNNEVNPELKNAKIKELNERVDLIREEFMKLVKKPEIPKFDKNSAPTLNVYLSSLHDPKFLEDNKDALNNCKLNIILNENEMKSIYKNNNTLLYTNSLREKYKDSQVIQKRKDYFDENSTIDRYNLISSEELRQLQKQINPISIKVKESLESAKEYSLDELDNASHKIDDVANIINLHKNLSPYEKFYLAFMYVAKYDYKKYDVEEYGANEMSRNLLAILNGGYIVCAGKANMLKAICDRIGVPCIYRIAERHAVCTIGLNDPKYNIYGLQTIDPTNQELPVLYNEENPMRKDLFIDINWISALTYRQKDYLLEESGLFFVPKEVLDESAKEFNSAEENVFYVKQKDKMLKYMKIAQELKAESDKQIGILTKLKENYKPIDDVFLRWIDFESHLKDYKYSDDKILKSIITETGMDKIIDELNENFDNLSLSELYLEDYRNNNEEKVKFFVEYCEKNHITITKEGIEKYINKFEKTVIPTIDKCIELFRTYPIEFEKKVNEKINFFDSKIKDQKRFSRFIPVGEDVEKLRVLIEDMRTNHIGQKIAERGE